MSDTLTPPAAPAVVMRERLRAIIHEKSFRTGDFTLASGKKSTKYFNLKPTMMNPEGGHLAAQLFIDKLQPLQPDFVGGLEMGAVPLVAAIAAVSHAQGAPQKAFFIRKKAKEYGAQALVEGLVSTDVLQGSNVVMIEDVTTTGGSIIKAIDTVRELGASVTHAVTLLDRNEGARDALNDAGVELHWVLEGAEFN